MLMVPKSGSSYLTDFLKVTQKFHCTPKCRINWNFHNVLYTPCSLATLREPCSRIRSIYSHLREEYPHTWLDQPDINAFVAALKANWHTITSHKIVTQGRSKNLVLAMPQYLWIGNASRVVCTERMDAELPGFFGSIGCCQVPNASFVKANIQKAAHGRHHDWNFGRSALTAKSYKLNSTQGELSSASCHIVRELYWQDDLLYRKLCSTSSPSA